MHDYYADKLSDGGDVASILFWEWQPRPGFEEEAVNMYSSKIAPMLAKAPEILQLRWFKIRNATVLNGDSFNTLKDEDLHTYMSLVEMDCEEWPWGELLALNDLPEWSEYFEGQKAVVSLHDMLPRYIEDAR